MTADHYDALGVEPGAAQRDVQAAYRRLMREHHPDLRPGDAAAAERARQITAAWAVLGRPAARAAYDRRRAAARLTIPVAARPPAPVATAYSSEGSAYRRAFHLASLKVASVVMTVGVVALVALSR